MQYIYPRLYSLHDMPENAGMPDPTTGEIVLPAPSNLSSERLVPFGLYLIDDGQTQFLWLGRDAISQLTDDVFGTTDRTQVRIGKTTLPILENDFNERVRAVIDKSRDQRAKGVGSIVVPHLYVVREDGEPSLRLWAQTLLVEDRADQGVSLAQWMGTLREKVSASVSSLSLSLSLRFFALTVISSPMTRAVMTDSFNRSSNEHPLFFLPNRRLDIRRPFIVSCTAYALPLAISQARAPHTGLGPS